MPNAAIQSIAMSVAERVMTNEEFEKIVETSDEWIQTRTGIKERRVAEPGQSSSYFGAIAAADALKRAGVNPEDVDMVICATVTGDHLFPGTACLIQERIGAKNAGAFDVGAACAGFIYAAEVASSMIRNGTIRNAVVVGVDTLTHFVDWSDRSTCVLFGDGGGAAYMEATEEDRGIVATVMLSDGSGAKHIKIEKGGSLYPPSRPQSEGKCSTLYMAGKEVFRFAVRAMADSCHKVLEKAGLTADDVTLFCPHQANLRIITAAAEHLGLPMERVFVNVQKYGNMGAGSIPVALYEAEAEGALKKGDLVMTVGFGAGLVWGANLIRW
ncbi:MAG: ketoacyl-ACP synthase III [Armatimonadetes bacterium]|nr:MAG: ketoacyl-ACP synthase III [Armatimonadota bacterium]